MKRRLGLFGIFIALGVVGAGSAPARAAIIELNGSAPHLCMAVSNSDTAYGTAAIAASCSGAPNYQWSYVNGQLQTNVTANGQPVCLTPPTYLNDGFGLYMSACGSGGNQNFILEDSQIISVGFYGNCVDSSGGPPDGGGTQLVINPCSGAASQSWIVRAMALKLSGAAPYVCASVEGGDTASGTPVVAYSCDDSPPQIWSYILSSDQIQGIGTAAGNSTCLTVAGPNGEALVTLSTCSGSSYQRWTLGDWLYDYNNPEYVGSYVYTPDGYCLDGTAGPSVGGGRQLVINPCSGAANQIWSLF